MDYKIFPEWDEHCGISGSKMYPLQDGVENALKEKNYGASIDLISVVITCTGKDFKQRKRFKKEQKLFEYDILLDYFLIKNVEMNQKKEIIRRQMIEITEHTFSKYKFVDFDRATFLSDFNYIVNSVKW